VFLLLGTTTESLIIPFTRTDHDQHDRLCFLHHCVGDPLFGATKGERLLAPGAKRSVQKRTVVRISLESRQVLGEALVLELRREVADVFLDGLRDDQLVGRFWAFARAFFFAHRS